MVLRCAWCHTGLPRVFVLFPLPLPPSLLFPFPDPILRKITNKGVSVGSSVGTDLWVAAATKEE